MTAVQEGKKRYELVDTGAIFVPNVDADVIAGKVKAKEWKARPDLDKQAEKVRAEREKAASEKDAPPAE